MQNKIKFIIIAIAAVLLISIIVNVQTFRAKKEVERQRDVLKEENTALQKKIEKALEENKRIDAKLNLLQKDFEKLTLEMTAITAAKEELQKQFEIIKKDKDALTEKIKTLTSEESGLVKPSAVNAMADAYWAGILKKKSDLELQVESLKNELNKIRLSNAQLQTEKGDLDLEVSNYTRQNDDLKRQIEYIGSNQKSIDMLTQDLVREKNDKFQIQNSLSLVKGENSLLRRQLKSLGKRNISLERRMVEYQGKNRNLEDSFVKVETLLKDQMLKMSNLKGQLDVEKDAVNQAVQDSPESGGSDSVELPPIVVSPREGTSQGQLGSIVVLGKVLSVDRENNFAVIDLGENAGVKKGDMFQVFRGDQPIGELSVMETRRNYSACDIRKETATIQSGDKVK
jgi:predicted  nucleic acid-binding Zn-ribbon protein